MFRYLYFIPILLLAFLVSCDPSKGDVIVVDFNTPAPDSALISFHQDKAIHVAIGSMISPRESFLYYNDLLQHISESVGVPIHYIQKESYQEVNRLLELGAVDFAFISSGACIEAFREGIIDLMVAPVIDGRTKYRAYIITNRSNPDESILELKGKSFVFTDPLSLTGYHYPMMRFQKLGIQPERFFQKTLYTYGHDLSIQMVNRGIIDAASVNGLIYDHMEEFDPDEVKQTKIIEYSDWYGIPPVVTPKNLDPKKFKMYQNLFLNLDKDVLGKQILSRLNVDRYTVVQDSMYNSIRQLMQTRVYEND